MLIRKPILVLGWLLLLVVGVSHARTESLVQRYFQDLTSLRADFVQTVFDAQAHPVETSSGQMFMQKPGRFRWNYKEPTTQVVVADGKQLWTYDSELKQATVRTLDKALSATPLALLSGVAPLQEAFTISPAVTQDDLQWYQLTPKQEQAEFKVLRVAFKDDTLNAIELEDTFNQRTRLNFAKLERNVTLDPTLFRFVPPPGVDVVGDIH